MSVTDIREAQLRKMETRIAAELAHREQMVADMVALVYEVWAGNAVDLALAILRKEIAEAPHQEYVGILRRDTYQALKGN